MQHEELRDVISLIRQLCIKKLRFYEISVRCGGGKHGQTKNKQTKVLLLHFFKLRARD
jgi:hypothetical protein